MPDLMCAFPRRHLWPVCHRLRSDMDPAGKWVMLTIAGLVGLPLMGLGARLLYGLIRNTQSLNIEFYIWLSGSVFLLGFGIFLVALAIRAL